MKPSKGLFLALLGLSLAWPKRSGAAEALASSSAAAHPSVRVIIWPALPLLLAHRMIDKYGPPDEVYADRLIWRPHWPWKRIVVSSASPSAPLEQVVDYRVPPGKLPALAGFSRGLVVYAEQGELAARGDREEVNRLSLNLADDIVAGRVSPQEARRFFQRVMQLSTAGKSSPYLQRLLFKKLPAQSPPSRMERF